MMFKTYVKRRQSETLKLKVFYEFDKRRKSAESVTTLDITDVPNTQRSLAVSLNRLAIGEVSSTCMKCHFFYCDKG